MPNDKIPVMKILLDQFSRCFNSTENVDEKNDTKQSATPFSRRPLSSHKLDHSDGESSDDLASILPNLQKSALRQLDHCNSAMSESDREQAQVLAHTRQKATEFTQRHKSLISLDSVSKANKIEKAIHKSNKRKLDIFRNIDKPAQRRSSISKFLSSHKSTAGSMLCFANPIFDSQDDDPGQYRGDISSVNDEETITSTLFFDAKYAHVVEQQSPVALYREWSLEEKESKDDIVQIFEKGLRKTIPVVDINKSGDSSGSEYHSSVLLPFPHTQNSKISNCSANDSVVGSVISGLEMSPMNPDSQDIQHSTPLSIQVSDFSNPEFAPHKSVPIEGLIEKEPSTIKLTSKTSIGTARTVSSSKSHSNSPRLRLQRREESLNVARISELESCYHDD